MKLKKITAIINEIQLDNVAKALNAHGVKGFTIHPVSGRGNYCNTYSKDGLVTHKQIEVYTVDIHAQKVAGLIMEIADVGLDSEGLVAITSVDELLWVYEKTPAQSSDFNFIDPLSDSPLGKNE
ncbi:P-II family nitrogen regulator [Colwellia ponticola]|uniref:P-II family nitrogen regulator n=1 Tax=Colwellia ponticola TaxID=2304625 RepID=A0A8H2JJ37_9GAMM|nr:P-II family nitrogen regulator [Colwellia ponticola]TMM42404.1 P-II family nitrogen regulator [Colwellia ponticola]